MHDETLKVTVQLAQVLARAERTPHHARTPPRPGGPSEERPGFHTRASKGVPVSLPTDTALLFPGQGSQTDDMRDLVAQRAPELLERVTALVGEDPFAKVAEIHPLPAARHLLRLDRRLARASPRTSSPAPPPATRSASWPPWPPPAS